MLWFTLRKLKSGDVQTRLEAIEQLGKSRRRAAVGPLIGELDAALRAEDERITSRRKPGYVPPQSAVRDSINSTNLQWAAVRALGRIADARAVPALLGAMSASDWHVRREAIHALGSIKHPGAVEPLLQYLDEKKGTWEERASAAWALQEIGDRRATEPLRRALNDDFEGVREAAKTALAKLGA